MIKNFLTRYRPRYIRTLVYMLQSSEYNLADYLAWFHRIGDFSAVEKRKQLKKTSKALLVWALAWALALVFVLLAIWLISLSNLWGYLLGVLTLVALPFLVAYGVTIPLVALQIVIQKPIEYVIIQRAKKVLEKHTAIKIGVAGSFGKTTMREILKTVLAEGKHVAAPPYSYNTPLGISSFVKTLNGDEEVLIFEMGEYYPGDVRRLCDLVQPDIGVITGINEAHLHKFKTLNRTVKTIYELADHLGDKPVYVNGENELAKDNARPGHIVYSRSGTTDINIENASANLSEVSFTLSYSGQNIKLSSSLLGMHQIGPLAVSADIALRLGLSPEQVQVGIANTKPFDHRLEPKTDAEGIVTLDDSYNGNPDGVKAVINFLALLKNHRRFYVTPGLVEMGARTEAVHRDVGKWLAEAGIEKVVLIKNSVTPYIEQGLKNSGYQGEVLWFDEALQAFSALPQMTVTGDVVLLQNDWPDQYA